MGSSRPLSSSSSCLPYRILNINHKQELLRSLCVAISRVKTPPKWAITIVTLLITPLLTTP